jgi:chemotaxis methyl-accepting protein methylase
VSAVLRVLHARTQEQAQQILDERPELLPAAINALLIGVTSFFRDESVFETLRTSVLPQLAMQRRPLRIWSAGCSNGAELYSVAILLAQAGMLEGSFLLGSDCRSEAVEQARAAAYDCDDLRLIEPAVLGKYFEMDGHGINRDGPHFLRKENRVRPYLFRPVESLRRQVHWKTADVCGHIEDGPWDIILWRNMAIYLTAEAGATVWRGLVWALEPQGVLVVGKAERPPIGLELVSVGRYIYRPENDTGRGNRRHQPRPANHGVQQIPEMFA